MHLDVLGVYYHMDTVEIQTCVYSARIYTAGSAKQTTLLVHYVTLITV